MVYKTRGNGNYVCIIKTNLHCDLIKWMDSILNIRLRVVIYCCEVVCGMFGLDSLCLFLNRQQIHVELELKTTKWCGTMRDDIFTISHSHIYIPTIWKETSVLWFYNHIFFSILFKYRYIYASLHSSPWNWYIL